MKIRVVRHIEFNGQGLDFTAEAAIDDHQVETGAISVTDVARELFDSTFKKHPVQATGGKEVMAE